MNAQRIQTSRVRRAASMSGVAAGVAVREATSRAAATTRASEATRAAAARRQLRSARSLVKLLGGMRGAAQKVGQTLSAVDLGLVPDDVRPEFQEILATLQQDAEPVSFAAITAVVQEDLEGPLSATFQDFSREPIAAASIGQVHRATLRNGRDVAVKVQYPGIAEAIHSDLQNLRLGLRLLSAIAPGIDSRPIAAEIRERVTDELDYELEASNQAQMARIYRDHPFVVVPDVVASLCRERVLVTDFVQGRRLEEVRALPADERDRLGEILVRFFVNGPLRHRLLNGDPHPGNVLFPTDGRVAFVDFGFCKRLGDTDVRQLVTCTRAVAGGDAMALLAAVSDLGVLPPDPALAETFLERYQAILGWLTTDGSLTVEASRTAEMMRGYLSLRGTDGFGGLALPAEHFVLLRAVFLLVGLLGGLRATGTWRDVAREWMFGDEPATELGHQEAAFLAGRIGALA